MSQQIKFKRSLFGISKKPIVEYIESISKNVDDKLFKKDAEITQLKKEIELLNEKNASLLKEINDFEEEKKKISDIFIRAEETAKATVSAAESEAQKLISDAKIKVDETLCNLEREQAQRMAEFNAKIAAKEAELKNYKNEISYLREKIKVTLGKFDEILANSIK